MENYNNVSPLSKSKSLSTILQTSIKSDARS